MEKISFVTFESMMERLRNAIRDYYNRYSDDKIFDIFLANGERITYTIPQSRIAHLLGVHTDYLASTSLFTADSKSSIEILKNFCQEENVYSNYKKFSDHILNYNNAFSEYFTQKIDAFDNNVQPNVYQGEFICKIDKSICHYNGTDPINVDYLICSKDESDNHLVLGISKDNVVKTYVPTTNQLFHSLEELKGTLGYLLDGQELTLISRIIIKSKVDDYSVNAVLPPNAKALKATGLTGYEKEFNAHTNINYEYSLMAKQSSQNYDNINSIISWMESRKTITANMAYSIPYLSNNLKNLINAYNNVLNSQNDDSTSYSDLQISNETMKKELYSLREMVTSLTEQKSQLQEKNDELVEERDIYKGTLENVQNSIQKTLLKYRAK